MSQQTINLNQAVPTLPLNFFHLLSTFIRTLSYLRLLIYLPADSSH